MKKLTFLLVAAAVSLAAGYWAYQWQLENQDILLNNHGYAGGDFTLQSAAGEVSLSDFRGQPVLVYFGYAYCPDICPSSLAVMGGAMKQLEADGIPVKGIFISVDPERDTPESLKIYAEYFHPQMLGVTSDKHRILEVATRYGAYYKKVEREAGKDYLVDHTSRVYVINADGELATMAQHGDTPEAIADKVRSVL